MAARRFVELADRAAGRMELRELNLEADMSILYAIDMPVPRWPVNGELKIGDRAVFLESVQRGLETVPLLRQLNAPLALLLDHVLRALARNCRFSSAQTRCWSPSRFSSSGL